MRVQLTVAYDGTNYCGWQIQPNGITVEEILNKAIKKLTGEETAGRFFLWESWAEGRDATTCRRSGSG